MENSTNKTELITTLRKKIEELLQIKNISSPERQDSNAEIHKLIHQLDVHQTELETQNKKLLLAKKAAETETEKYISRYNIAPSGYITLSKEGEIIEYNPRSAAILGKEHLQLIKKQFRFFVSDETKPIFDLFLEKTFEKKTKEECEVLLAINPNQPTPVLLRGNPSDNSEQCFITMVDITQHKKTEEITKTSEEKYHALFNSNRDSITLFRMDSNGEPENFIEANPAATAIFGYTKKELLSLSIKDLEIVAEKKRKARIEVLQSNGKIDFETIIEDKKGNRKNVEIKAVVINYMGKAAIMNITRDITERKQMENNVAKANENLATILEAIPDLLFEVGLDSKIYHYQAHQSDLLALPLADFTGKLLYEVMPENVVSIYMKAIQEANDKGWSTGHQYAIDLPKGKFWFELSVSPIKGDLNKNRHFIILAKDITERKKSEQALQKSQEKLRGVFDLADSGILLTDLKGKFLLFNNWCTEILGYTRQEMNKLNQEDITHPDDLPNCRHFFDELTEGKIDRYKIEKRYIKKDKSHFWAEISVSAIKNKENKVVNTIGIITDINERKADKEALLESKKRLQGVFDLANSGIILTDTSSKILEFNDWCTNALGYTHSDLQKLTTMDITHPDDYENSTLLFNKLLEGKVDKYQNEKRYLKKDKSIFWGEVSVSAVKDESNKILYIIGIITDITKRKLTEELLLQNEKKYRQSEEKLRDIIDSTDGIVWESDAQTLDFTFVSKQAERLLGFPVEDWYKTGFWTDHLHPKEKNEIICYCAAQTKLMQKHDFVYRFKAKNGNYVWLRDIVNVVLEDGKPRWLRGIMVDITQQKETNESLIESEEKYRRLIENSPDAIVIYADEKIVYVNEEGFRMIRAKNESEVIGKSVMQFIHPESQSNILRRMKEVNMNNNATATIQEKFIRLDGTSIDVEIKAIPTIYERKLAVQFIVHDITERKRSEEKIRQLSQAVEQSPVTIVITNTKGEIEYVNPKFTETTGYTFDEIVGKKPRILKSGHTSQEEYKDLWYTLEKGKEWHGEFHNKKKNGELYWESASISPIINTYGKTTHFIAIKENITERKKTEQELVKAKNKAEESDHLKSAFLANMSHEIRTPMNGILGFTELLKEPKLSGNEQQEYIKIIEKSGKRMLNIINDIINISKVESGQIEVSLSETNINEQIEYLNTFFKPETKQKGIKLLVMNQLSEKESLVLTDPEKIYAILTNLVKNAIKFTESGSISFGCAKKENNLEFFVKDTGMGISKSQQKIVFERFRQANETITRTHEGSGLGLAISKAYVEMLGGKIWVESKKGKGSTFFFTIPYRSEQKLENEITANKKTPSEKVINKIKNLKILIVEDDAISKLLITIAVKPYSREILKVSTGYEAIEACRSNPDIDLVMMDINMPEMGGHEATKQIREFNKDLIIIAQTANGMQNDRDEALAAGCTDYISKPVNIHLLGELIQKYFKEK